MSSAVANLCHFKGSMEVFHWVNSIQLYFWPWGRESSRYPDVLDNRSSETKETCDLQPDTAQLTPNRCLHLHS